MNGHYRGIVPIRLNRPQHMRVFVVDDELLIQWPLAESLAVRGYEVSEASDDASAHRIVGGATDAHERCGRDVAWFLTHER
jgi:PleD family two-component response regulator